MSRIRFDRNEFSGAFGDMGTDFPLLVGIIAASGMDCGSVFVMFGLMQILTGWIYRMPMPVQPLKAMAAIIIAQKVAAPVILGGGLAIGAVMLVLTLSGAIEGLGRLIPLTVVRGIQFGLGLQLSSIALKEYIPSAGAEGYVMAAAAFVFLVFLLNQRRYPAAAFVILAGIVYALVFHDGGRELIRGAAFRLPQGQVPAAADVWTGFFLLALPQIPLSLGNSMLATRQVAGDYFPERKVTLRKIGLTYSLMNLVLPFFGGVPVCHGSGGMVGHYLCGGRTGGSVMIYGTVYLVLGLFFSEAFGTVIHFFPLPLLGVILLFEGLFLASLVRDRDKKSDLMLALLTGIVCGFLKYGFVVGMIVGTGIFYLMQRGKTMFGRM